MNKKAAVYLLLLLNLTCVLNVITVNGEIECPPWDGELVFIPDPEYCEKYYICTPYGPELQSCPSGLWWDSTINGCNWPEMVECIGKSPNFSFPILVLSYKYNKCSYYHDIALFYPNKSNSNIFLISGLSRSLG